MKKINGWMRENVGYASLTKYFRSHHWRDMCAAKLAVTPKCEICWKRKARRVFLAKLSAATMNGQLPRWLVSVCPRCNYEIRHTESGQRREHEEARKYARKLLRERQ